VRAVRAAVLWAGATLLLSACGGITRQVEIPRGRATLDSSRNVPATITGSLTKPDGDGPFGAVVLLHGCSGLPASSRRLNEWAQWYRARGWVSVVLDSFGPRGVATVCATGAVSPVDRAGDAYAVLRHLAALPYVRRDRIVIQGLSHGGTTVLRALDDVVYVNEPLRFAGGIAFYPVCSGMRSLYAPAIVLIGELDDWTPAVPCQAFGEREKTAAQPVEVTVYPGAYHSFDFDAPRRINDYGKVLEYAPAATADAERRVDAFLRRLSR
jgi:dienelactone hydrolase